MAKATTLETAKRSLQRIPVAKIVTGLNVRTDATPDPEFVASVKANGILQPPTVTPGENDTFEIVFGHRRANAAALAGLTEIDAIVIDAEMAETARLVDQLTENDMRVQLTDTERTAGYQQLELFSVSPADIAKRLGVKRDRVDVILKVAKSESASKAIAEHGITLDQAAQMVEFDGDKSAVKRLSEAAEAGRFDHALVDVRRDNAIKDQQKQLQTDLEAAGITRFAAANEWDKAPDGYNRIDRFGKKDNPVTPLEVTDVEKEHLGARIVKSYSHDNVHGPGQYPTIQYFVAEAAGFPTKQWEQASAAPARELTPAEIAANEQREKDRAADEERRAAWTAAAAVRRDYLIQLTQRTKLPDYIPFLAWMLTYDGSFGYEEELPHEVLTFAGIDRPAHTDLNENDVARLVRQHVANNPKIAGRVILAIALEHAEGILATTWRPADNFDAVYLSALADWGYGLSEIEEARMTAGLDWTDPNTEPDAEPEPDEDDLDRSDDDDD